MAIPSSGSVSLAQLQNEFGGSGSISLSEYYRGGAYVPNTERNGAIPTGGGIALSQFRNTSDFQLNYITAINANSYASYGDTVNIGIGSSGENRAIILSRVAWHADSGVTNDIGSMQINGGGTEIAKANPNTGNDGQLHTIHFLNISPWDTSVNIYFTGSSVGTPHAHMIYVYAVRSQAAISIYGIQALGTKTSMNLTGYAPNSFSIGNYFFNGGSNQGISDNLGVIGNSVYDSYMSGTTGYSLWSSSTSRYLLMTSFGY